MITYHCGPFAFTIYGGGTSATLRKGDYSVHWQGDDAHEIVDFHAEHGREALDQLWQDYRDIASYEGIGPEPEED